MSTRAQTGRIQKNKGKQIACQRRLLPLLEMPAIFVMPEPHTTFILKILKDQAHANEKEKER